MGQPPPALRVLHVVREASGGMLTHLCALVRALSMLGVESCVAGPPQSLGRLQEKLERTGPVPEVSCVTLPVRDGLRPVEDVRALLRLRRVVEGLRPDVVHAHGHKAALTAALAVGRRAGTRAAGAPAFVVTVHNFLPRRPGVQGQLGRRLLVSVLGRADRVITVSRVLEEFVEELRPGVPVRVVRNALEPAWVLGRRACGGDGATPPEGRPVVAACVMRLHRPKGIDALIAAAARLPAPIPLQVWIAGDGPQRAALERQAARLGLDGRVRFLGYEVEPAQVWAASQVAVLPWLREGASYSALEAMAAGLPVISFDCPGCREALPEDGCLAVAPGSVEGLAEALQRLAADAALRRRMGQAARRAALSRTAHEMASETLAVYREVAGP